MNKTYDVQNERACSPDGYHSDCHEIYTVIIYWQSKMSQCFVDLGNLFVTNFEFLHMLIYDERIL